MACRVQQDASAVATREFAWPGRAKLQCLRLGRVEVVGPEVQVELLRHVLTGPRGGRYPTTRWKPKLTPEQPVSATSSSEQNCSDIPIRAP
jgi:hypothetical protein